MNGGYIMVDCKGMDLTATSSQTISGLYAKCEKAMESGKPILFCNCVYGEGANLSPIPVYMLKGSAYYNATLPFLYVTIGDLDDVTISSN